MLWTKDLEIGVELIDEQHKELFRRVNALLDAGRNDNRAGEMIDFLGEYVVKHFHDEEALQIQSHYPGFKEHQQKHIAFVGTFKRLKQQYEDSGESLEVLMSINNAATEWLMSHIMGDDKTFAQFYRKFAKL